VIFDTKDKLHSEYLKYYFNLNSRSVECHVIPSVKGFRLFAENGYACALIPELDILTELNQKKLVKIFPDKPWKMPMYWHSWSIENMVYQQFNELVLKIASELLQQK
jgi:LysR family transcriptional regulator (chromosome initiation inhibitor)